MTCGIQCSVPGRGVLGLLGALLVLAAPWTGNVAAKDALPRIKRSAEFKYVDEADDTAATAMLPKLLKKYDDPKKCRKLLSILRTKRSFPGRMPSRMTLEHVGSDDKPREFTYILPSKYSKRKPTGVLLFLHGAVSQGPPGGGANEAGMFAPAVKRLNLIVIGPSTYNRVDWGAPPCRELVHHALDFAKQHFNVDEDRVYVAGDSDGGRGAFAQLETEATFLAAAVPVIGAPGGVTRWVNLRNVPIYAINGETDTVFPIDHVRDAVEGMKKSSIDIRFQVIEGQGHDPRFFLTFRDDICDFLEAHRRTALPSKVEWQVDPARKEFDGGFPANTFRWIRIEEAGSTTSRGDFEDEPGSRINHGFPRIEATCEENRIAVKTRGVKRYTILVSDEMLDLTQPIRITTNGHPSFEGRIEPEAQAILEEARRFKDRKLVFANRITIEVDREDG